MHRLLCVAKRSLGLFLAVSSLWLVPVQFCRSGEELDESWQAISALLESRNWDDVDRVTKAFSEATKEELVHLSGSENVSLSLRSLDELYLQRTSDPASVDEFLRRTQTRLGVKLPYWLKEALKHGERETYGFSPNLEGIDPYMISDTREVGQWYLQFDQNERRMGLLRCDSSGGSHIVLPHVRISGIVQIAAGESSSELVVAVHSLFPKKFPVMCVDLKTQKERWRVTCKDADNIGFYSGSHRSFLSIALTDDNVVISGVSASGVLFIEVINLRSGAIEGRYSSVF